MPAKKSTLKPSEVTVVPALAKELLAWKGQTRPFKKRSREYFSTLAAIAFLVVVILLFIKEWFLIGVVIALSFLAYVLSTVPPEKVVYKLTTWGVEVSSRKYRWEDLRRFWFSRKWDCYVLHLETLVAFPRHLQLVFKEEGKKREIKEIIAKYLVFEKPEPTYLDKAADWLQKKIPLDLD